MEMVAVGVFFTLFVVWLFCCSTLVLSCLTFRHSSCFSNKSVSSLKASPMNFMYHHTSPCTGSYSQTGTL